MPLLPRLSKRDEDRRPPHRAVELHELTYIKHSEQCLAHGKCSIMYALHYRREQHSRQREEQMRKTRGQNKFTMLEAGQRGQCAHTGLEVEEYERSEMSAEARLCKAGF